jgi:hypothetical protein
MIIVKQYNGSSKKLKLFVMNMVYLEQTPTSHLSDIIKTKCAGSINGLIKEIDFY